MDAKIAAQLAEKLQISLNYVVKEESEMRLLKEIFDSEFGKDLVFKGGTALRLAYGSPRFSEDLDFTATKELNIERVLRFLRDLTRLSGIIGVEAREKFYTVFALVKVQDQILPKATSIKIEASKRAKEWIKGQDFDDMPVSSEVAVFRVIAQVAKLEQLLVEKEETLKNRNAPRDRFDYWFIKQLLGEQVSLDFSGLDPEVVKSEMHRLLPRPQWRLIKPWLEKDQPTRN